MRFASESKPHDAIPMNGRPPASPRSSQRTDEPVPAEREHRLAGPGGLARELLGIDQAARLLAVEVDAEGSQLALDRRKPLARAASAGDGVDDQGDAPIHARRGRLASKAWTLGPSG